MARPETNPSHAPGDTARRIVEAAEAELVSNNGSLEMLPVARRAGVSVGLAYHHFGSKSGLLAAVVEGFYARHEEMVGKAQLDDFTDWAAREHERVRRTVVFHYGEPLAPLVLGRLTAEPEVAAVEKAHFERQVRRGAWNIAQGQKEGIIPSRRDPGFLVAMVLGGVRAGLVQALARASRPSAKALTAEIWHFVEAAIELTTPPPVRKVRHATASASLRLRDRRKAALAGNRD